MASCHPPFRAQSRAVDPLCTRLNEARYTLRNLYPNRYLDLRYLSCVGLPGGLQADGR